MNAKYHVHVCSRRAVILIRVFGGRKNIVWSNTLYIFVRFWLRFKASYVVAPPKIILRLLFSFL